MAFDLVPGTMWNFPFVRRWPVLDDDEDWTTTSSPSGISVSEDERNVYVEASLPGIDPKDVEVTFDKGVLWIKAEARDVEEDKKKKYYHKATRSFSYRIAVPGEIDAAKDPMATSKNGIMKVTFEKKPQAQPKKINVKTE